MKLGVPKTLELLIAFSVLMTEAVAQENETKIARQQQRTFEIVFVLEAHQRELSSAVDKIMQELQSESNELSYRKVFSQDIESQAALLQVCEMGSEGISLLIDSTPGGLLEIQSVLARNDIPYFNFDYSIQSFVRVLEKFLNDKGALDAVLIFQSEKDAKEAVGNFVSKPTMRIIILNDLSPASTARLKTLRPTPDFYAILANTISMESLFRGADNAGLISQLPDRWNLMFYDFEGENFEAAEYPEVSRLILNRTLCCNPKCDCSLSKLRFRALSDFLHLIAANRYNSSKTTFSCNENESRSSGSSNNLLDLPVINEESKLFYLTDNSKIFLDLKFILKGNDRDSPSNDAVAYVDRSGTKTLGNNQLKSNRRFMRVGVTESIPYTMYKRDPSTNAILRDKNNFPLYEGFCIDFIEELSRKMNFSYELVEPRHGKFGARKKDGSFDGLIGDLTRGVTDFTVAAMKMTADREEQIDFVAPYFDQTGIRIVMKKPQPDTSLFKFMTVLRLEVWLSILGALSVTAFVIWILEIFSPYSARNFNYAEKSTRKFTLRECFWLALTSFTPQGGGEAPKALSGRVIVAAYWLFVVLMLATFTANLAAFLTVERMITPIQSLEQLSRQSRINYTTVKNSDTYQYFRNMKHAEDKLYELWKNTTLSSQSNENFRIWDYPIKEQYGSILMAIDQSNPLPNASEGFRIVNERTTNDFAFIFDANEIKYEISRNCNLSAVGDVFAEQPYAVAVPQGSLMQDELSKVILELQKERFFDDLTAKYWNASSKGSCMKNDDSEGITLESLGGVFIATFFGLLLAIIVLITEVCYYKKKSKKDIPDSVSKLTPPTKTVAHFGFSEKIVKSSVLLGPGDFTPVDRRRRLSFISVSPRD